MNALTTDDFRDFFSEVWDGKAPFAWQQELLEHVVETKTWPDLVDIPTGLGKTATVDIALFSLALEATVEPDRSAWVLPHRIVMVVDRRVIVDQAHARAKALDAAIRSDAGPVATRVRQALRFRAGAEWDSNEESTPPLITSVLRGGIVRDETWARRPDVPAVLASTVDQVGSRLLFRGYGLSTGARPIHAGLLANDTLYLLDEVHLARPFAETLDAIRRLSAANEEVPTPHRLQVVQLSATPAVDVATRFPERPLERPTVDPAADPVGPGPDTPERITARRTGNSKPADLREEKVPKDPTRANEKFAKAVAKQLLDRLGENTRLAVMVNRVDTARRVAKILDTASNKDDRFDVVLLTGRMRTVDRERILATVAHRLEPGPRLPGERPLVVVATQSLEAGADFDFDVLVTECASIDALRQRFGRVDRDGQRWLRGEMPRSVVLCRSTDADGKTDDPVYGSAISATWAWLGGRDDVDFGYGAMDGPFDDALAAMLPPVDRAPLLSASHLDRWCRTSEREVSAEPDVAQWLHGVEATNELADVQVIWRDGIDPSLLRWDAPAEITPELGPDVLGSLVADALEPVPPLAAEALAVPIREVRRWLRTGDGDPLLADAPATPAEDAPRRQPKPSPRLVARWVGDATELIPPEQIRPGDTIIVPATAGGIAGDNWDPTATEPVTDHSRRLFRDVRDTALVLLTEQRCADLEETWPDPDELDDLRRSDRESLLNELIARHRDELELDDLDLFGWRAHRVPTRISENGTVHSDYLVTARIARSSEGERTERAADDLATDSTDDALSMIGRAALLDHHLAGVGHHAERFARALGWDEHLVKAVKLAGEVHDAGKADSRFQFMLAGGTPTNELLAKSAVSAGDPGSRRVTRRLAGYPAGTRHELLSLALIDDLDADGDIDFDLVKHLVATHHGWGRYRFRPVIDRHPEHVEVKVSTGSMGPLALAAPTDHGFEALGTGHDERFWELTGRYGWWTLAHLEAVLRLADHHRSHLEQLGRVEDDAYAEEGAP